MSETKKTAPRRKRTCAVCGKEFYAYGRQIYCSAQCRKKEMTRRANPEPKRKQKKVKALPAKTLAPVPTDPVRDCPKDCRFLGKETCTKTCDYLLITGVPRDCEIRPGGCDKYEKNGGRADEKL